jgi:hypothetical protein
LDSEKIEDILKGIPGAEFIIETGDINRIAGSKAQSVDF